MFGFLGLIKPVVDLLVSVGIIKTPEQRAQLQAQIQQAALQAQQAQEQAFSDFLKATTPDANRVYVWANSMIAITRPAITWLVTGSIVSSFFIPGVAQRMTATVAAFSSGGTAGLMLLSIPLWWFAGRSAEKIWAGDSNPDSLPQPPTQRKSQDSPVALPPTRPVAIPTPPAPSSTPSGFSDSDSTGQGG